MTCSYLVSGRLPPEPSLGEVPHLDRPPDLGALQPGPLALVDRMLESFRDALGAATADSPLILILDHLDGLLQSTFQQELYPGLIRRVADQDDIPNLRLVVALTTDQVGSYWPAHDRHVGEWIDVDLCRARPIGGPGRGCCAGARERIPRISLIFRNPWQPSYT